MTERRFDLICLGRAAVDLYGEQIGSRLEDMQTFAKYVGGSAANIAIGSARQGLKVSMLTRVGDEHMGRFVCETFVQEGVDTSQVSTDPERLTGLVILGIRDRDTFPLIFYRENCADMGLAKEHVDPAYIASAKALLVTGTHFSQPGVDAASREAIACARRAGTRVVLDIDYRPVLWGLTGHGLGEERFVANDSVSSHLQSIISECDLVVGTEEEIHIAGGSTDTLAALRRIRELSSAVIVLKRGPGGCTVFDGPIPDTLDKGIVASGFPVEVLNVLGAGDAFMSGLLRGWIAGEPWEAACRYANGCGALVVTRHGCAPAMPTRVELDDFLERHAEITRPEEDARLTMLHRQTAPRPQWPELCVLAIDNRLFLEQLADEAGVPRERLTELKHHLLAGGRRLTDRDGMPPLGVILDDKWGFDSLAAVTGTGWWIARPIEQSGVTPLTFLDGRMVGLTLRRWPREHVIKTLVQYHPDLDEGLRAEQLERMYKLYQVAQQTEHELLLEIIPPGDLPADGQTLPRALEQIYARGIRPQWWKLQAPDSRESWRSLGAVIEAGDPWCRGVLILGGGLDVDELTERFRVAATSPHCRGFAVGRTIFAEPSRAWLRGEIDDSTLEEQIADRFARVIDAWCGRER